MAYDADSEPGAQILNLSVRIPNYTCRATAIKWYSSAQQRQNCSLPAAENCNTRSAVNASGGALGKCKIPVHLHPEGGEGGRDGNVRGAVRCESAARCVVV